MRSNEVLEVAHSNICGPFGEKSLGDNTLFISFIDEHGRKMWIYLTQSKDDVFVILNKFKTQIENQSSRIIKFLRCDCGGEWTSNSFESFCEVTTSYTPQHNGLPKIRNINFLDMVRCMVKQIGMPKSF